jgi:hypothetical protein
MVRRFKHAMTRPEDLTPYRAVTLARMNVYIAAFIAEGLG